MSSIIGEINDAILEYMCELRMQMEPGVSREELLIKIKRQMLIKNALTVAGRYIGRTACVEVNKHGDCLNLVFATSSDIFGIGPVYSVRITLATRRSRKYQVYVIVRIHREIHADHKSNWSSNVMRLLTYTRDKIGLCEPAVRCLDLIIQNRELFSGSYW